MPETLDIEKVMQITKLDKEGLMKFGEFLITPYVPDAVVERSKIEFIEFTGEEPNDVFSRLEGASLCERREVLENRKYVYMVDAKLREMLVDLIPEDEFIRVVAILREHFNRLTHRADITEMPLETLDNITILSYLLLIQNYMKYAIKGDANHIFIDLTDNKFLSEIHANALDYKIMAGPVLRRYNTVMYATDSKRN